jgi:hypothetical protein
MSEDPTDMAVHGGSFAAALTAFGVMARSLYVSAQERRESVEDRKALIAKIEELSAQLKDGFAKSDRELALLTQLVGERSRGDDVRDAKLDDLERRLRGLELRVASRTGEHPKIERDE